MRCIWPTFRKTSGTGIAHAQINPHFLYNTLSSISRLARFGMLDKQRMVMDLAKFYRLSLNDGRNIISVKNELEQAQAYVDIQKIKYDERMQVTYDFEPEVVRYETVKLILPFIENVLSMPGPGIIYMFELPPECWKMFWNLKLSIMASGSRPAEFWTIQADRI